MMMVPPVINKFYIVDIAPGRSMVEYFVAQGLQVFVDLVAQSRRRASAVGIRRLLRSDHRRAQSGRGDHRLTLCARVRHLLGWDAGHHGGVLSQSNRRRTSRQHAHARCDGSESNARRAGRRRDEPGHRRSRHPVLGTQRLPRRSSTGRNVRLAAPNRFGVALLG